MRTELSPRLDHGALRTPPTARVRGAQRRALAVAPLVSARNWSGKARQGGKPQVGGGAGPRMRRLACCARRQPHGRSGAYIALFHALPKLYPTFTSRHVDLRGHAGRRWRAVRCGGEVLCAVCGGEARRAPAQEDGAEPAARVRRGAAGQPGGRHLHADRAGHARRQSAQAVQSGSAWPATRRYSFNHRERDKTCVRCRVAPPAAAHRRTWRRHCGCSAQQAPTALFPHVALGARADAGRPRRAVPRHVRHRHQQGRREVQLRAARPVRALCSG